MPTDIIARQIAHAERAHGKAEFLDRLVDLLGTRTLIDHGHSLRHVLMDHAIADESIAHARDHRGLLDLLGKRHRRCQHIRRRLGTAHHFEQLHDVGRTEKVQPDDILRTLSNRRDVIDIERRSVRGKNRARLHDGIELGKHLLLDAHLLEYRLDDEIRIGDVFIGQHGLEQRHARLELGDIQLALLDLAFEHFADTHHAAIERVLVEFEQAYANAGVQEVDADATAHGSRTDDRHLLYVARLGIGGQIRNTRRRTLGKENMPQCRRHSPIHELLEQPALFRLPGIEAVFRTELHRIEDGGRCGIFLERGLDGISSKTHQRLEIGLANTLIPRTRQSLPRLERCRGRLGDLDCGSEEIRFDHRIEQRRLREHADRQRFAGQHDVQRVLDADQTRQTLRTAGTRQ